MDVTAFIDRWNIVGEGAPDVTVDDPRFGFDADVTAEPDSSPVRLVVGTCPHADGAFVTRATVMTATPTGEGGIGAAPAFATLMRVADPNFHRQVQAALLEPMPPEWEPRQAATAFADYHLTVTPIGHGYTVTTLTAHMRARTSAERAAA